MTKRVRQIGRVCVVLLAFAILAGQPVIPHLLDSGALSEIVGGNYFCSFVAGVGFGLGVGAMVSAGACVFCDAGVLIADGIGVGCAILS